MIPITATILHPQIVSSHHILDFGVVHVASSKAMQLVISNPSLVAANWSVSPGSHKSSDCKPEVDQMQHIGCYHIDPPSGSLDARNLAAVHKVLISVTFSPQSNSDYQEEIEFVCKRGQGYSVILKGKGSLHETAEFRGKLHRI